MLDDTPMWQAAAYSFSPRKEPFLLGAIERAEPSLAAPISAGSADGRSALKIHRATQVGLFQGGRLDAARISLQSELVHDDMDRLIRIYRSWK